MQLMTLNIWGGHVYGPLVSFIEKYKEVDIFCFQEVYHNAPRKISTEDRWHKLTIFAEIHEILKSHQGFFRPAVGDIYGIGMFVKNSLEVVNEGEVIIHDNLDYPGLGPTHSRNLQWVECQSDNQIYSILNVHGLWNGRGKTDSPERITQSQRMINFMNTLKTPKILCGDFNLNPDTESMKMLEEGMNNLIKTHNISSTRTNLYPKDEKFADYILVSQDIAVNKFEVLPDEVSDHAPLLLDFA